MRILYLSVSYVPSRRASSVQVMKMCEAMAQAGHRVTLVTKDCPARQEPDVVDDYAFYGVEPQFELLKLPRPVVRGGGLLYLFLMFRLLWRQRTQADLVFSRDLQGAWMAALLGYSVLFEAHGLPRGAFARWMYQQLKTHPRFKRLVVISKVLRDDFATTVGLPLETVVAHDAAPASTYYVQEEEDESAKRQIGYIGSLYPGKGMEIIVQLAEAMPDYTFSVIGGRTEELQQWREKTQSLSNLHLKGYVAHGKLPAYFRSFQVVLLPNQRKVWGASGQQDIGRWTSPLKMFEYMAAGKAIVSSELPVLCEVLEHERNALLVSPDNVAAWQQAIERLCMQPALRHRLGQTARKDVENMYTWSARAQSVLHGLT